jgi:AcrR family transcriptional regulator
MPMMAVRRSKTAARWRPKPVQSRDRERTRRRILEIAFEEFAENGLSGGNTDTIAARAKISKRLIFYYFKTKEDLFTAVLEMVYSQKRLAEENLGLDDLEPEAAIRNLASFTVQFDQAHPQFVRLVSIENIHRGRHVARSRKLKGTTQPIIDQIARVLARGEERGVIRPGIDACAFHMTLSALSFFAVANRHTFEAQFDYDMSSSEGTARRRDDIADIMWRYVRREPAASSSSNSARGI